MQSVDRGRRLEDVVAPRGSTFFVCAEISFNSDIFNSPILKSDLEVDCFRHFVDGFMPLLTLSRTHPGFTSQLVPETVEMLLQFEGTKDVVLACGASHKGLVTGSAQMNEAGIRYYASAVAKVNRALNKIQWEHDDFNDALLYAIIMLYIHGVRFCPVLTAAAFCDHVANELCWTRCSMSVLIKISASM